MVLNNLFYDTEQSNHFIVFFIYSNYLLFIY